MSKPSVPPTRPAQNWRTILAWDGLLPLGITAFTVILRFLYPGNVEAELFAFFGLPFIGALLRASVGVHQLRKFTGGSVWWRQILLAVAIVLLLFLEAASAIVVHLENDPDVPLWFRLTPAGIYACYLPVVILAFWRFEKSTSNTASSS